MYFKDAMSALGHTPLVELPRMSPSGRVRLLAKLEGQNLGGSASIKDRVAKYMLDKAEQSGQLPKDKIIIEATSGNTGIALAWLGYQRGYRVTIVMPDNMSVERKKLIRTLGAELILTSAEEGIKGSVDYVNEMAAKDPNVVVCQQFENPDNPRVHYEETAHELWRQMRGDIDSFVAGVGSGGTLQGVGKFLKEHNENIRIIAVEPKDVSALLGHEPGLHQIQGIGDGFVPEILDVSLVDEVIEVTDEDAIETTRQLGRDFGMMVGISSGANVWAARQLAKKVTGNITTVLPDRAERYFSTALM